MQRPKFRGIARALRAWPPWIAAATSAGCGAAPPPPPSHPPLIAEPPSLPPPPPPLSPARWVSTGGATMIGPALADGVLVLLGGRRAIVGKDGAVKNESAPSPEPLLDLIEVPSKQGARRLVGRSLHGVYLFGEPLGRPTELAHSEVDLRAIGGGPGLVAIWDTQSDLPRLVDLETGHPASMPGLPELPLRALAFLDAKDGAAVFMGAGLAITNDGGASFRPASDVVPGGAMRVTGLHVRAGAVRARTSFVGREGTVDLGRGSLSAILDETPPAGESALLHWIRVTGRDPLEAAVTSGVDLGAGSAAVASHGLLARVDTTTAAVSELVTFAAGSNVNACFVARAGGGAWVACAISENNERDLYDPFGVMHVALDKSPLAIDSPALARNGEAELRASPSGGVMLVGPCSADEQGQACVRQPNGRFATIHADLELAERGAGPLADGRVAFVRGLFEGDEPADAAGGEASPGPRRPYVAVVDPSGKEAVFAPPGFGAEMRGELRLSGHVEEEADGTLRFVVDDERGPHVVVQPPDREAVPALPIPGAAAVRVAAGRGISVGHEIQQSLDEGGNFVAVPAPSRVTDFISHAGSSLTEPNALTVGDVGVQIGRDLRIGWGPSAPLGEEAREAPTALLPVRSSPPPRAPEQALACTSEGPSKSAPPIDKIGDAAALFGQGTSPRKGVKRVLATIRGGRSGPLEPLAVFEEQGPDKPGAAPATWTFHYYDPTEPFAKPRTISGPAPAGVSWNAAVRGVAASESRAIFTLKTGNGYKLVRAKGTAFEAVDVDPELTPPADVAFGSDRGEPIAWLHETALIVWLAGEAPRVIASLGTQATRTLGEPTRDGVPVVLSATDWSLLHVFPIPPAPKSAKGAVEKAEKGAVVAKPGPGLAPAPMLTGWTPVANVRREVSRLPACAKGSAAKDPRFRVVGSSRLTASVDAIDEDARTTSYELRLTGNGACIDALAAAFPEQTAARAPAGKNVSRGPVGFIRADLAAKKADGGDRSPPPGEVRKLACSLAPR